MAFDVGIFVDACALMESGENPEAWGDSGLACGQWQQHPSFFVTWGPKPRDFGEKEHSWDWAFEFAIDHYAETASTVGFTMEQARTAYRLHWRIHLAPGDMEHNAADLERFRAALQQVA
jgi:hypothetical protein